MRTAIQLPVISPFSQEFGGMTTTERQILFPDGSIEAWLPKWEGQSMTYGDTYGCVGHSQENGYQVLTTRLFDTFRKKTKDWLVKHYKRAIDFSDRDLVVLSGTMPGVGNSGDRVLATAQQKGLISQELGDWDMTSRDSKNTVAAYYTYKRSEEGEALAKEWRDTMEIKGEWVHRKDWDQASREGVLQLYVNAWYKGLDGKYYNPTGGHNHAVILLDYKSKRILDTYKPEVKELRSYDDVYQYALKLNINEKPMKKPNIKNNSLVILVEGLGAIGLYLDDKIIIDDVGKIMAVYLGRNAKNGEFKGGPVMSLTQAHWDMFDKYDLGMKKL